MRPFLATVVCATLVGISLSACAASPGPTPIIYWAEAQLHVVIKAIEPAENRETWSVTFEINGQEMQALTAPGVNRPSVESGDMALVLGKVSQAGDLLITSITVERSAIDSPDSTQGTPRP